MFQFPEFALMHLCIQCIVAGITGSGFPIRTSSVQSLCSNSPKLFAATNVLHRLLVPRHPPYTLSSLALFFPKAPTSFTTPRSARGPVNLDTTPKARIDLKHSNFNLSLTFDCQRAASGHRPRSGGCRARTDDPRLAKPMLSQLS